MVGLPSRLDSRDICRRLSAGGSIFAFATAVASPAWASCSPYPVQPATSTTCTGQTNGPILIDQTGSMVTVSSDASVVGGTSAAIQIKLSSYPASAQTALAVDGIVDGNGNAGVVLLPADNGVTSSGKVVVSQTASITGTTGILVGSGSSNHIYALVDNSGVISATAGPALVSLTPDWGGFDNVTNRANGWIGGISGAFATINNAGTINGGVLSAIDAGANSSGFNRVLANSGSITSSSSLEAIRLGQGGMLQNGGIITNTGSGAAVSGQDVSIENAAGAGISGGSTAINVRSLNLINRGTITGSITAAGSGFANFIDSVQGGVISGNVTLGNTNDVIVATLEGSRFDTGIAGILNAGGGTDRLQLNIAADRSFDTALMLPTSIEELGLAISNNATITLEQGFNLGSTIRTVDGSSGTLINKANLSTTGPGIISSSFSGALIDNRGSITANLTRSDSYAVVIDAYGQLTNSGTIDGKSGGGVSLSSATLTNSGIITADGTGVIGFQTTGQNSGTILSRNGTGLITSGNVGLTFVNSGTISGTTTGVQTSIYIDNSGTISSSNVGVRLDPYGGLINREGGLIEGGHTAVTVGPLGYLFNARVYNEGTIRGDIDLHNSLSWASNNIVIAGSGSTIEGNVYLGSGGDLFVTDLVNKGSGALAGVTGTVSGSGQESLIYRVNYNASTTYEPQGIFSSVGYDIRNDATLSLSLTPQSNGTLWLAGQGQVSLQGDLTTLSAPLLATRTLVPDPGDISIPNELTVRNAGRLNFGVNTSYLPVPSAIALGDGDSFINEGLVSSTLGSIFLPYPAGFATIVADTVDNRGSIELDSGTAILATQVTNSGIIRETEGTNTAAAISGTSLTSVVNSGQITVDGTAIFFGYGYRDISVINSGTISSTSADTIFAYATRPLQLRNEAGGLISAGVGHSAIAANSAAIVNAGRIEGDVRLDSYYGNNIYVSDDGTLDGNLTFGAGNDMFVALDGSVGITGTIDAGAGVDTFIYSYSSNRSVDIAAPGALPSSFENIGIGASGAGTIVTLTSSQPTIATPLTLVGDGTIVNVADFSAANPSEQLLTLGSSVDPLNLSGGGSTLTFVNQGKINGTVGGYAASFTNEGTISNSVNGMTAVELIASSEDRFTFQNSGTIVSPSSPYFYINTGVTIQGASDTQIIDDVAIGNSGSITGGLSASLHATEFSFANDGTIEPGLNSYLPSVSLSLGQSYYGGTDTNADKATISNGGKLTNGIDAAIAARTLAFSNSGTISSSLYGTTVSLIQTAHETRDMTQGLYGAIDQESLSFANSGTLNGSAYLYSAATSIAVANSGTIAAPASNLVELDDPAVRIEGNSQNSQAIAFTNSGGISTNRPGASAVSIESDARSVEQLRNGFDETDGPIAGEPTTSISVTNSGTLSADGGASYRPATTPPFPWYPSFPESLSLVAALSVDASSGGLSRITVTNETGGVISATGATRNAADAQNPVVAGLENLGSTAFVGRANQITLINAGTIRGLEGGMVPVSLLVDPTASDHDFAGQFLAGAIQTIDSADSVTNLATGVITGSVNLGALDDSMANYGTINGTVYLGEGNDRFIHGLGATLNGMVDGGAGTDALVIDISGGGLLNQATFDKFVNFEEQSITGTGTITTNGPLSIDSLILRDANLTLAAGQTLTTASDTSIIFASGTNSLINLGTITGALSFAGGTNSFVNLGSIAGPVTLGGGSNSFTIGAGSSVSGPVVANGTDDLLILATGGTDAAPQELRLSSFTGFERTRQDSGTLALSGDFTTGQLILAGGRFIGRTGSVLNTSSILVNQGTTFGSAGTVNGDIIVQGILSPGSSPGTMTINGNVALSGSSATLFEMTPTISDALIINGTLNIAPGATLKIIGNRPLTPGVTYELITTTSGIVGSFTTIDKASTVVGFVRQGNRSIDLLGQFVLGNGASGQVMQTVDYLNGLLIAGTATNGLLNAAPSLLLADGTVNQAAAARLNAESYASAAQIGIENGLAIASTLRSASITARGEEAGLFTFGQTLGGWRRLPGDTALGTSRANISTYGALAGIGFGSQKASLGAFVGYIDARQQIGALAARTEVDGIMAGAVARAALDGFHIAASLSYDGSRADTDRSLLSGSKLNSHYRLRSWTADISLGHAFGLGNGWNLEPEIGFTHISSRRGSASETGDAVWALDVEGRRTKASFLRGALELHGAAEARLSPWISAGVLHQLSGTQSLASAAYVAVPDVLTVAGVGRSKTLASVGAGANLRVSSAATLCAGVNSEFGAESSGQGATVGLRFLF